MEDKNETDNMSFINGLFLTHKRIHEDLMDASYYRINGNPLGTKENLRSIYKTIFGLLNKAELKDGEKLWNELDEFKIKINNYSISYDDRVWAALDNFDFFLRKALVGHGITFSMKSTSNGMGNVWDRYGLKDEESQI